MGLIVNIYRRIVYMATIFRNGFLNSKMNLGLFLKDSAYIPSGLLDDCFKVTHLIDGTGCYWLTRWRMCHDLLIQKLLCICVTCKLVEVEC